MNASNTIFQDNFKFLEPQLSPRRLHTWATSICHLEYYKLCQYMKWGRRETSRTNWPNKRFNVLKRETVSNWFFHCSFLIRVNAERNRLTARKAATAAASPKLFLWAILKGTKDLNTTQFQCSLQQLNVISRLSMLLFLVFIPCPIKSSHLAIYKPRRSVLCLPKRARSGSGFVGSIALPRATQQKLASRIDVLNIFPYLAELYQQGIKRLELRPGPSSHTFFCQNFWLSKIPTKI